MRFSGKAAFGDQGTVEGKVRSADTVIIATGRAYHCVSEAAEAAAERFGIDLHYLNTNGSSSLARLLLELYEPDTEDLAG